MLTIPKKLLPLFFSIFFFHLSVDAQNSKAPISFGIQLGTFIYQGDLVPSFAGSFRTAKPMISLLVNKPISNNFSLRGSISAGQISADENAYTSPAWRQTRAFNFNSPLSEIAAVLVFDFADQTLDNTGRISPYVFAGGALSFLNIHRDWSKFNYAAFDSKSPILVGLGQDTIRQTPSILPVIPIGAGVKYTINSHWSMTTELNYRYSFSDYIDGFSKSANPHANDSYYSLSIGLNYHLFNNSIKCLPAKL
jgi:opacity protein-like surface antigen